MSELFFFIKAFALTLVMVVLMQIRIGGSTIEDRAMNWVHQSSLTQPLHDVAEGGVKVVRELWTSTFGSIRSKFFNSISSSNLPGSRSLGVNLERSRAYLQEQAIKAAEQLKKQQSADEEPADVTEDFSEATN